jgi:hypothetical protein
VESAAPTMERFEERLEFGASATSSHQGSVSSSQAGRVRGASLRIANLEPSSTSTSEIRSSDAPGHTVSTEASGIVRARTPASRRKVPSIRCSTRFTRPSGRPSLRTAENPWQRSSQYSRTALPRPKPGRLSLWTSWSIRFEPGRCHGSTCLRLRTKGSCELLTASWRTRSAARRDEAGVLSVGSFKPETNHGVPHAHRRLCNGGASRRSVPSSLGCSGGGLKETVLAGLPEDQLLGRPASE